MLWDLLDYQKKRIPDGTSEIFYSIRKRLGTGLVERLTSILNDVVRNARDTLYTQDFSYAARDQGVFKEIIRCGGGVGYHAHIFADVFVWAHLVASEESYWYVLHTNPFQSSGLIFFRCNYKNGKPRVLSKKALQRLQSISFKSLTDEQIAALGAYPNYKAYLQSPEWQARRRPVLIRADGRCEECKRELRLSVHHKHYDSLGAESPDDLLALCNTCHGSADRIRGEESYDRAYSRAMENRNCID